MLTTDKSIWDLKHEAYCSRLEYGKAETVLLALFKNYQIYLYAQSNAIDNNPPTVWGITLRVCEGDMAKVGCIKGRMRISDSGKKALYVESLEVSPENRREGLATFLLKLLFLIAVQCKADYLCGEFCPRSSVATEIVQKFYIGLGFQIDHDTNAMLNTKFANYALSDSVLQHPIPKMLMFTNDINGIA